MLLLLVCLQHNNDKKKTDFFSVNFFFRIRGLHFYFIHVLVGYIFFFVLMGYFLFCTGLQEFSQNSIDWAYNFKSIQHTFIKFQHIVNYTILYQNPNFKVCIIKILQKIDILK